MIILKNDKVTIKIQKLGAELKSMNYNGTEYIWEGRPEVWNGSNPLLFPICGGLKDDRYEFEGKSYTLPKHGFARSSMFDVESCQDTSAVFLLKSNEETKKNYPFDFELRVIYTLEGLSLKTEYKIDNKSDKTMYFSIGSHEAFYTPEGIEDYDVIFPQKETLNSSVVYGNVVSDQTIPIIKESEVLPLYDKYFTIDALIFKDLKSRSAILRNQKTGKAVKMDFDYADYFLLWHKPNAPYMCLEPWAGFPDTVGSDYDITKKEGIIALDAGKAYLAEHTISVIE